MHLPVSGLRDQTETIWWPLHWFYDQLALSALCRIESLKSVIDILPWRPFQAQDSRQWPYCILLWAAWSWCYWSQHKINIPPEWLSQAHSSECRQWPYGGLYTPDFMVQFDQLAPSCRTKESILVLASSFMMGYYEQSMSYANSWAGYAGGI